MNQVTETLTSSLADVSKQMLIGIFAIGVIAILFLIAKNLIIRFFEKLAKKINAKMNEKSEKK